MTRILHQDYVFVSDVGENCVIKGGIIQDFSLEWVCAVKHQAVSLKGALELREAIDVFLVFIDGLEVDLEGAVGVQIEKESCLEHLVFDFGLDLFYRVFQTHAFEAAQADGFLDHALAWLIQVRHGAAVHGRCV